MKNKIRKISFLIIAFVFLTTNLSAQKFGKKNIKTMCENFEATILKRDYKASLDFFEPEYKKAQHDDMLGGNTQQFLAEFLAGYEKGKEIMTVPKLAEIDQILFKKIKIDNKNFDAEVQVIVVLKNKKKIKDTKTIYFYSPKDVYFVGGMG